MTFVNKFKLHLGKIYVKQVAKLRRTHPKVKLGDAQLGHVVRQRSTCLSPHTNGDVLFIRINFKHFIGGISLFDLCLKTINKL